jgi:hypothetical protein
MKTFLTLFLFCSFSFAAQYNYKNYWSDSGFIKVDKTSAYKVLVKQSPVVSGLPIAALTITRNNHEKKETVIQTFKKSVGPGCQWKQDKIEGLEIHECALFSAGSFFRLAYNNKTNDFSTGSLALRYILPTYVELHLLQAENLIKNKSNKKSAGLIQLLVSKAYALTGDDAIDFARRTGDALLGDSSSKVANALGRQAESIDAIREKFTSKNIARAGALAGLAFGAMSTISSMATNFIVNGTYSMLRTLFYEIKGDFTPEEKSMRLQRFDKALTTFKDSEPLMNSLATQITLASTELTLASGMSLEEILSKYDSEIEQIKSQSASVVSDCIECQEKERNLRIEQIENLKDVARKAGVKSKFRSCENLDSLYKTFLNAEYGLLTARKNLMQDLRLFNGKIIEAIETNTVTQENRKQNNACTEAAERGLTRVKTELQGENCELTDFSSLLCQQFQSFSEAVNNCKEMENVKFTTKDTTDLVVAAGNVSKGLVEFSKDLGSLSCDEKRNSCSKGQLDIIREEMKHAFSINAKACPNNFFSKQFIKNVEKPPKPQVEEKCIFLGCLSSLFSNPSAANRKAAEKINNWNDNR